MREVLLVIFLLSSPALAQESNQKALSTKLLQELSENVTCQAKVLDLQKQVDDLEKKLAEKEKKGD